MTTSDQRAIVVGATSSSDFPVTAGAVQSSPAGDGDAVVVRLTSSGAIDYATYLGGPGDDYATDVAVDTNGDMYVAGIRHIFPRSLSHLLPRLSMEDL